MLSKILQVGILWQAVGWIHINRCVHINRVQRRSAPRVHRRSACMPRRPMRNLAALHRPLVASPPCRARRRCRGGCRSC